jgi:hypothetical protein
MKNIVLIIFILWSGLLMAQPATVPGYININENRNQKAIIARAFNAPVGTTAALKPGQPGIAGAIYGDTTGGNKGLYWYRDGAFVKLIDTSMGGLDSSNFVTVKNIAELKANAYYANGSKIKSANDRPVVFVSGYYNPNDGGGGQFYWDDTAIMNDNKGTIIKPTAVSGAGRWKRIFDREINILWFGAKKDHATDIIPALDSAIKAATRVATNNYNDSAQSGGTGSVYIPGGTYYAASPIIINSSTIYLHGEGSGIWPFQETRINFAANVSGIIIRQRNAAYFDARSVRVENMWLRSGGGTDSTKDGFNTNTKVEIRNVAIEDFGGNGFAIVTNDSGNCNNSTFWECTSFYNAKHGFYFSGQESNNCKIYGGDISTNGQCGVYDNSFLGNTYYGVHVSFNGLRDASGYCKAWVKQGGKVYQAIKNNFKAVQPTVTSGWENYWILNPAVDTSVVCLYNVDSTYWITGAYVTPNDIASCTFFNCYSEGGQGMSQMNQFSFAIQGDHGAGFVPGKTGWLTKQGGHLDYRGQGFRVPDKDSSATYSGLSENFGLEIGTDKINATGKLQLKAVESDTVVRVFTGNDATSSRMYFPYRNLNAGNYGRTGTMAGGIPVIAQEGIFFVDHNGTNGYTASNKRMFSLANAMPSISAHGAGDFILNTGTDTTIIGWRILTGGNPGTNRPIYSGNDRGKVTSISAGYGMNFSTITGSGSIIADSTKLLDKLTGTNISGAMQFTSLLTAKAGINFTGSSSPLQVGGSAGTSGQAIISGGAGNTAVWGNVVNVQSNNRVTAQTGAASLTAYSVGASDESLIVSANILVTTSTTHSFTTTVTYTDEGNTSRTVTLNYSNLAGTIATGIANAGGAIPYEGIPIHIRAKASTTVTIATTGTFTTVTYNFEGNVTKIN